MSARDDYPIPESPWGPVTFEYVGPKRGATGFDALRGIFKPSRPVSTEEIVWMCRMARDGYVGDLDLPTPPTPKNEASSKPTSELGDEISETGDSER